MPGAAQQRVRSGPSPAARLGGGLEVRRGALSSELESEMRRVAAGAAGEKLLLCTLVIAELCSPHFIPSPSHPPDGTCTTLRVKNVSPRITKNWL